MQGSKDKYSGAAVDGVNPASGNMLQQDKQKSCALGTVVEDGSKKRAHVEAAEDDVCGVNPDNMHQQNYTLQEKENRANVEAVLEENKRDHVKDEDEDKDDEDYVDNEDQYKDENEDDDDAENEDEDEGDGGGEMKIKMMAMS